MRSTIYGLSTRFLFALLASIAMSSALSACASMRPSQAFDKPHHAEIRHIALLRVPDPQLKVTNLGGSLGAFGLLGGAMAAADEDTKSHEFADAVAREMPLATLMRDALESGLKKQGYLVTLEDQRPIEPPLDQQTADDVANYSKLKTEADAILDVSFLSAGYLSPPGSGDYVPWLHVKATLVSARSRTPLYVDWLVYGAKFGVRKEYFPTARPYAYGSFSDLMDKRRDASEGLARGIEPIAGRIAQQLR